MKICPVCTHSNSESSIHCENCQSLLEGRAGIEGTILRDITEYSVESGDVIDGRYKVVRLLGEGGMGEVYLAVDLLMDEEECAIKLIHHALMRSPEARQRFRSEVSTSRRLHHSSIIKVYDMGHWEEQNQYYFTMEYLEGKTLAALIMKRQGTVPPFSLKEIGSIMEPLLQGLAYAHEHTIHRDIKPDNIMVKGEFPEVKIKILDFGIARAMSASRFTRTAQGLGTPHYMAPEQMEDAHTIDHRADLYGAGMILYELLTGKRAMGRFKPLVQVIGPAYAPMDTVVDTALAPDPEDRYRDAAAMLTDVENAMAQIGGNQEEEKVQAATPEEPAAKAEAKPAAKPAPESTPQTEPSPEGEIRGKKKNPVSIFAGLAALLLVAGFLYFSLGGGDKSDSTVEKPASPAHIEQPAVDPKTEQLAGCEQHRNNKAWKQAETCYRAVLEKFPDEQQAKAGLDTIYKQATTAGRRAVEQGDLNTARKQLALLQSFAGGKDKAKALQKQIADYEKEQEIALSRDNIPQPGQPFTDPTTGMEFVFVKGGCFQMGDTFGDGDDDEKPVHEVCVDDFYMGKYEVTQGEWKTIMGNNPSHFKKGDNYPVERVFPDDALKFIRKLNTKSRNKYRLPTEAEWEYAAREGGRKVRFGTGKNTIGSDEANFDASSSSNDESYVITGKYRKSTVPVDSFSPNALGLYNMSGNVWEWCSDRYDKNYYKSSPRNNPQGSPSGRPVARGGSWFNYGRNLRSACRDNWFYDGVFTGFRLARGPEPVR